MHTAVLPLFIPMALFSGREDIALSVAVQSAHTGRCNHASSRSYSSLSAFLSLLCPQASVKSAGPTTALAQVLRPPCCCARGWRASQARSRSTTPTETRPSGASGGEDGPRGIEGAKASATFTRWNSSSSWYNVNIMQFD